MANRFKSHDVIQSVTTLKTRAVLLLFKFFLLPFDYVALPIFINFDWEPGIEKRLIPRSSRIIFCIVFEHFFMRHKNGFEAIQSWAYV